MQTSPGCSLQYFPEGIKSAGYEIKDASYVLGEHCAPRQNGQLAFHKVHFYFAPAPRVGTTLSPKEREATWESFHTFCRMALWRVRGRKASFSGDAALSDVDPVVAMIAFDSPVYLDAPNKKNSPPKTKRKFVVSGQGFQILSV